jgi:hypothetical protein|tara:strand:- start:420 stop:929 length:510 start_codon:yes stop_codon:yes gene_type:complete
MTNLTRQSVVDVAIGLISLGLGLSVYFLTFGFQIGVSSGLASGMDASLYPRLIASILTILGLVLLVKTLFLANVYWSGSVSNGRDNNVQTGTGLIKLFPLGIGFTIAFPILGYFLSTGIFVVLLLFVSGERRPVLIAAAAFVIVLSFYLLFRYGFNIVLPSGQIWRHEA